MACPINVKQAAMIGKHIVSLCLECRQSSLCSEKEKEKNPAGGGEEGRGREGGRQRSFPGPCQVCVLPMDPRRRNYSPSGMVSPLSEGVLGSVRRIRFPIGGSGGIAAALRRRGHFDRHIFHFLAVSVRRLPARRREEGARGGQAKIFLKFPVPAPRAPKIQLSSGGKVSRRREGRVRVRRPLKSRLFLLLFCFFCFLCLYASRASARDARLFRGRSVIR